MQNHTVVSRRNPRTRGQIGFTLIEIMIVVMIIGVLMNIAVPSLISARDRGQARACVKSLSDFVVAKEQFAMDNRIPANSATTVTWTNIQPYVRTSGGTAGTAAPTCPSAGGSYTFGNMGNTTASVPKCTYGGPVGNLHVVN